MKFGFLLMIAFALGLPFASHGSPYFIPESENESRLQGNSFHAWPLVFLDTAMGIFDDEEKTFREPQMRVREVKKSTVLRLDRSIWISGRWVEITEPDPPLSPSELF